MGIIGGKQTMKLNELRQLIREEVRQVMDKNNQLEEANTLGQISNDIDELEDIKRRYEKKGDFDRVAKIEDKIENLKSKLKNLLNENSTMSGNILIQKLTPKIKQKIKYIEDNYPNLKFSFRPNSYYNDPFLKGTYTFSYSGPTNKELELFILNLEKLSEAMEDSKIFQKNKRDIIKLGLEGARDWKRGISLDYGPYKDKDSFEYMYWKKGWEDAELKDEIKKGNKH
jgi:hypothetical protein